MWCKIEACSLQTVGTAAAAPRFIHEVTGGRTEALSVEGRRSNYGFGIEKKVDVCRNVALTVPLVWCDVTERTGEGNFDWRNRADWRAECCLKEQSGLESRMLTEGTERTGEQNVVWRNRADWRAECWLKEESCRSGNRKKGTVVSSARNCFLPSNSLHCCVNAMSCCSAAWETNRSSVKKLRTFLEPNVHYHIQSTPPFCFSPLHAPSYNLILFYRLYLSFLSGLFPSGVLIKDLCELQSSIRAICPSYLIILYFLTPLTLAAEYNHTAVHCNFHLSEGCTPYSIHTQSYSVVCCLPRWQFDLNYRGADKSLLRPGSKQSNVSFRMACISFGALLCRKINLTLVRVSMLLKSRFHADMLPRLFPSLSD